MTAPGGAVIRERRERRRQCVYDSYRDAASDPVFRRDMAEVTKGFEPVVAEGLADAVEGRLTVANPQRADIPHLATEACD